MNCELRCRKIIVTGGGSGIGLAIAKKLLEEGADVCIAGRNEDKLKEVVSNIQCPNLSYIQFDINDIKNQTGKLNDAACLLGGYFDGIVNAAGIHYGATNWYISEEQYDQIMDIDLKAPVFLMRKAAVLMINNNIHGNILQISSVAGNKGTMNNSPYYMAKNSLINATRHMAKEVANKGIVINGIAPGLTHTQMCNKTVIKESVQAIARTIEPDEIANIAIFLLSRQAEICIGDTLIADGGFWGAW